MMLPILFYGLLQILNALVHHKLKPRYRVIAKDILISEHWAEFTTEKPAHPRGHTQNIFLSVPGYKFDMLAEEFNIKLSDGTIVDPEIQVLDGTGRIYDTEDGSRSGSTIGLSIRKNIETGTSISHSRQEVTVRIRSHKPFRCSAIGWVTKRMK